MTDPIAPELSTGKILRTIAFWAVLIVGTIALVQLASERRRNSMAISYNQFVQQVDQGNVVSVEVTAGRRIRGYFRAEVTVGDRRGKEFSTVLPFEANDTWVAALVEKSVEVRGGEEKQSFGVVLLTFLPYLLIFGLVIFMLQQMRSRRRNDGG